MSSFPDVGQSSGNSQEPQRINWLTYDAAGNITIDAATGGTMTYDAENRLLTATSGGGGAYAYDGEGKRVKRTLAGGQTWWYVYGIGGELVAEYLSTAPSVVKKEYGYRGGQLLVAWDADKSGNDQMKWLVTDHLGSTRMEADKSGSLAGMRRHDYAPFGEEMTAGIRSNPQYGYVSSNVRQKFGSKERDTETGLDYFGARYFASAQGRFTSIDPIIFTSVRGLDPQSLNLFSYVRNNPLKLTDPNGLDWYEKDGTYYWFDKAPKKKLGYHHINTGRNGYQITNVQGATGQYARYNGHNIILHNNPSRRLVDNGAYHPLVAPAPDPNAALHLVGGLVEIAGHYAAVGALGTVSPAAAVVGAFVIGAALEQEGDTPRVTLYRGVASTHPVEGIYEQALLGNAFPIGGHNDPIAHSLGDTNSIFTS